MLHIDLPQTEQRIAELSKIMGLFHADVVALAVDQLYQEKRGQQAKPVTSLAKDLEGHAKGADKKPRGRARKEK